MWHHQVETTTILPATGVSSSPSKSSSTCPSSSSQIPTNPSLTKKSVEEVRKDTNLASLCCVHSNTNTITTNPSHPNFRGMIFQDFLASPPTRGASNTESSSALDSTFFGSLTPPPATVLSLNSGSDFQNLENVVHVRSNPQLHSHASVGTTSVGSSLNHTFVDVLGSSSVFPSFCKEMPQENNDNSGGPRHKRRIKNRESAARSRARKQAYTDELELEVAHLLEENAKLRRQQEKFLAAHARLPKKHTLSRSSTAPF